MDTRIEQGTEEWKAARCAAVTCTDLGKILGFDHGCSRQKLLGCKRSGKDAMDSCAPVVRSLLDNGKRFEETCKETFRSWLASRTPLGEDWRGFVPAMHADSEVPYFTGSPDYLVPAQRVLAEFKTHFWPNVTDARPVQRVEEVRLKHYVQVQGYLRIMDYGIGYLVSWTLCRGYTIFLVLRDDALWQNVLLPNIRKFKDMMDLAKTEFVPQARMSRGEADANAVVAHASLTSHCRRVQ